METIKRSAIKTMSVPLYPNILFNKDYVEHGSDSSQDYIKISSGAYVEYEFEKEKYLTMVRFEFEMQDINIDKLIEFCNQVKEISEKVQKHQKPNDYTMEKDGFKITCIKIIEDE